MSPRRRSPGSGRAVGFTYRVVSPRASFTPDDFYSLRNSISSGKAADSLLPNPSSDESDDIIEIPASFELEGNDLAGDRNEDRNMDLSFSVKKRAIDCLKQNCKETKLMNSIFANFCRRFDEWNLHRQKVSVKKKGLAFVSPESLEAANEIAVQKWSEMCSEMSKWSKCDPNIEFPQDEQGYESESSFEDGSSNMSYIEHAIFDMDLAQIRVQRSLAMAMELENEMKEIAQKMNEFV